VQALADAVRLQRFNGALLPRAAVESLRTAGERERRADWIALAHLLAAAHERVAGHIDAALLLLERAERHLPDGPSAELASVLLERCEVLFDLEEPEAASRLLARSCAMAHVLRDGSLLAWALLLHGSQLPVDSAVPLLFSTLELAESLGSAELTWRAHRAIGLKGRAAGCAWLERDGYVGAHRVLDRMADPLGPSDLARFWAAPARRAFLDEWRAAPIETRDAPSNRTVLAEIREESRGALPAYVR